MSLLCTIKDKARNYSLLERIYVPYSNVMIIATLEPHRVVLFSNANNPYLIYYMFRSVWAIIKAVPS